MANQKHYFIKLNDIENLHIETIPYLMTQKIQNHCNNYVCLIFIGHQYPKTATAEDLLEIAFIQGIIPAVTQDQVSKPKPSKEGEKKKDWNNIDDHDDEWHSSVYDF